MIVIQLVHKHNYDTSLPLTLRSLALVSNTHGPHVCRMLWLWKRIRQWIGNILVRVHLANFHITSTNNFVNEMIPLLYMLCLFVCPTLLYLRYDSTIVTIEIHRTGHTSNNTQLRNKISDPNSFLSIFKSINILSFDRQICYSILLGSFSAQHHSIEAKYKTRL
jgi:hypothetical protein